MRCPKDSNVLSRVALNATYMDVCPTCLGVWLDTHELRALVTHFSSGAIGEILQDWSTAHTNGKPLLEYSGRKAGSCALMMATP